MASIRARTWIDAKGRQRTTYRVQIRRRGYPPVSATFERKTDAARWAREVEADMQRRRFFPHAEAERHTLADLVDRRLAEVQADRPHDYQRHRLILGCGSGNSAITPSPTSRPR